MRIFLAVLGLIATLLSSVSSYTPLAACRRAFIEQARRAVVVGASSLAILPTAARAENGYSAAILSEPTEVSDDV